MRRPLNAARPQFQGCLCLVFGFLLWLTEGGSSGAGQEQAVLEEGMNSDPWQQCCQSHASPSRAAPSTGFAAPGAAVEESWCLPPLLHWGSLTWGIPTGGSHPSLCGLLHVPPNCSLGSGQGPNEPCLPLVPCSGCRGLLHELAVNQNAPGRQFSASETCPHQGLGEGGELPVSR